MKIARRVTTTGPLFNNLSQPTTSIPRPATSTRIYVLQNIKKSFMAHLLAVSMPISLSFSLFSSVRKATLHCYATALCVFRLDLGPANNLPGKSDMARLRRATQASSSEISSRNWQVGNDDICPFLGKSNGHCAPNAAVSARDDRNPGFQLAAAFVAFLARIGLRGHRLFHARLLMLFRNLRFFSHKNLSVKSAGGPATLHSYPIPRKRWLSIACRSMPGLLRWQPQVLYPGRVKVRRSFHK